MKKNLLFMVSTAVLFGIMPTAVSAQEDKPANYMVLKGGIYSPSKSHDLSDFNAGNTTNLDSKTGFDGEVAIGHYFIPMLAVELGAGYFESKGSPATEPGEVKLKVIPVLATAKALVTIGPIEPYGEFGLGAYFTTFDVSGNSGNVSGSSKVTYGFHAGAGINFNITESTFIGVEGRYLWATPSFGGQDIKLDGFTLTADLGFRF